MQASEASRSLVSFLFFYNITILALGHHRRWNRTLGEVHVWKSPTKNDVGNTFVRELSSGKIDDRCVAATSIFDCPLSGVPYVL